ncbi:Transposon Tf2-11 polyprotein [Varanus komodoensis]|nr:Transposon Tf2-11 polyprotein [Varanus komodoensis]
MSTDTGNVLQVLQAQVLALQNELATLCNAAPAAVLHQAPAAPLPACFSRDHQALQGFVNQCRLLFQICPDVYPTVHSHVTLMASLLSGPAFTWVLPLLETDHPMLGNLTLFIRALMDMFGEADWELTTEQALHSSQDSLADSAQPYYFLGAAERLFPVSPLLGTVPLGSKLFEPLQGPHISTKLDLQETYNLVHIQEDDEWKTVFQTRYGHFKYRVMPFGLTNAPTTFQHFVKNVLRDMLDCFIIAYLNNIVIFSGSMEEHIQHVCVVLLRLWEHRLYTKLGKCTFHQRLTEFLGYIAPTGLRMDPKKIQAILDWEPPKNVKGVQHFLGFTNFYRSTAAMPRCPDVRHWDFTKMMHLLSRGYWWPGLPRDVWRYLQSCETYAQVKTPHHLPHGLLQPLPVPTQPWSMVTADFIVELLPLRGHMVILVVVDTLTKLAHFVPLSKLPTTQQMVHYS